MTDFLRKVGPKGQVVIPEEIRRATGIGPTSEVAISLEGYTVLIKKHRERISDWLRARAAKNGKEAVAATDVHASYAEQIDKRWERARRAAYGGG